MTEDDASYRRSVRNTVVVIAVMILVIAAALIIPPLVNPIHEQFNSTATVSSPYGLVLTLSLNGTQLAAAQGESITAWINSTSNEPTNVTASDGWALGPQGLWTKICTSGWPLGVGFMVGYYTSDNYTLGSLVQVPTPVINCPMIPPGPGYFVFPPLGSKATVDLNGTLAQWDLTSTLDLSGSQPSLRPGGVYTAVAADEWGDVAIAHFRVSQ